MNIMKSLSTYNLLYLKTAISTNIATDIQYANFEMTLPFPPHKLINYILELNHTSLQVQNARAKRVLNINKLIPIFIDNDTILFPITQKRASIKYFINARKIIGIHSSVNATIIIFENSTTLSIDIPYTLVTIKWQESLALGQIIEKTSFY